LATFNLLWDDEREREIVQAIMLDWTLYGEIHMTNAKGLTRLDPRGITYSPPSPSTPSSSASTDHGSAAPRKPRAPSSE
jgi:hypothetical protein